MSGWIKFNNWFEKHERVLMPLVGILLVAAILFCLFGCDSRGSLPPGGDKKGLGEQLGDIGEQFTFWGLIASGVGVVAFFIPALLPFRPIIAIVGEAGAGCAIFGGISVWISNNFWILVLACIATCLACAYTRRVWLRRWLDRIKAQAVKL